MRIGVSAMGFRTGEDLKGELEASLALRCRGLTWRFQGRVRGVWGFLNLLGLVGVGGTAL